MLDWKSKLWYITECGWMTWNKQAAGFVDLGNSFLLYRSRAYLQTTDAPSFPWSGMQPEPLLLKEPRRQAPLCVWSVNKNAHFLCRHPWVRFNFRPITASSCANTPAAANTYLFFWLALSVCLGLCGFLSLYPPLPSSRSVFIWECEVSCQPPDHCSSCARFQLRFKRDEPHTRHRSFIVPAIPQLTKQINTSAVY